MNRGKRRFGKYFAALLKEQGSQDEKLLAAFKDDSVIGEQQQEILLRLRAAWSMMLGNRVKSEIVPVLMQEFGISERQAYLDINKAQKVFGTVQKADKEAIRTLHYHLAQRVYNMAWGAGDFKSMLNAIGIMNELMGVNVDEGGLQDPESLKPSRFIMQINNNQKILNIDMSKLEALNDSDRKELAKAASQGLDPNVNEMESMLDGKGEG